MSDKANPASPPPPATSQTAPSGSGTSSTTEASGGTPDGREHTALTQTDAPASTEPGKEATPETETKAATPFDAAKLSFPEELGKPDEGMLNEFSEIAKSENLSQEAAQRIADLHVKAVNAASEENRKAWSRTIDSWENEIK